VCADGSVLVFGCGASGQLGLGATRDVDTPVRIDPAAFGGDSPDNAVVQVACGARHTVALTRAGAVYTWGWGRWGQLGHKGTTADRSTPALVRALTPGRSGSGPRADPVVAISAGMWHTVALLASGRVYAWGWTPAAYVNHNDSEMGNHTPARGKNSPSASADVVGTAPSPLPSPSPSKATEAGSPHCRTEPLSVLGLPRIRAIAAGGFHTLALADNGILYAWGRGGDGQLGLRTLTDAPEPQGVLAPRGFKGQLRYSAIAAGWSHSAAICESVVREGARAAAVPNGVVSNGVSNGDGAAIHSNDDDVVVPAAAVPVPAPAGRGHHEIPVVSGKASGAARRDDPGDPGGRDRDGSPSRGVPKLLARRPGQGDQEHGDKPRSDDDDQVPRLLADTDERLAPVQRQVRTACALRSHLAFHVNSTAAAEALTDALVLRGATESLLPDDESVATCEHALAGVRAAEFDMVECADREDWSGFDAF
jgi:hypothetical protein